MFIAGRRICLGQQLAQTELFIFAVTILQNFQIVLGQEEKPSLQPKVKKLVKSPENNYLVKLVAAKWAEGQSLYRLFILTTLWTSQIKETFSWGNAPKIHHCASNKPPLVFRWIMQKRLLAFYSYITDLRCKTLESLCITQTPITVTPSSMN